MLSRHLGGLLWFLSYNLQYVTTATFIATTYSEYLTMFSTTFDCPDGTIQPNDLLAFAKSQVLQFRIRFPSISYNFYLDV